MPDCAVPVSADVCIESRTRKLADVLTSQPLVNSLFETEIGEELLVYLKHVLVFVNTPEELLAAPDGIIKKLVPAGLQCNLRKSQLCRPFHEYVPYILSGEGVLPEPTKLDKFENWPPPTTGNGMLCFLRLCNYCINLTLHFADLSAALYSVTPEVKPDMNLDLMNAFHAFKSAVLFCVIANS